MVTADLQSQPLTQVMEDLSELASFRLVLDDAVSGKTVSASFQNLTVALAVKKILEGTGINYVVMAGSSGQPESIFLGGSARPGAPPRKLDNRPVNNRGIVTPVVPPPHVMPSPDERPNPANDKKGFRPEISIPTGGGFNPNAKPPPTEQEESQEEPPQEESEE